MEKFKNLKTLSLFEWFVFGVGKFLMGFSLGLLFSERWKEHALLIFLWGIILEIPSLYLVYKHR